MNSGRLLFIREFDDGRKRPVPYLVEPIVAPSYAPAVSTGSPNAAGVGSAVAGSTNTFHFSVERSDVFDRLTTPGSPAVYAALPVYSSPRLPIMWPISWAATVHVPPRVIASRSPRLQPPNDGVLRTMKTWVQPGTSRFSVAFSVASLLGPGSIQQRLQMPLKR